MSLSIMCYKETVSKLIFKLWLNKEPGYFQKRSFSIDSYDEGSTCISVSYHNFKHNQL